MSLCSLFATLSLSVAVTTTHEIVSLTSNLMHGIKKYFFISQTKHVKSSIRMHTCVFKNKIVFSESGAKPMVKLTSIFNDHQSVHTITENLTYIASINKLKQPQQQQTKQKNQILQRFSLILPNASAQLDSNYLQSTSGTIPLIHT